MPRSFGNKDGIQVSVVLPPRLLSLVTKRAEQVGSQAQALREAIESHYTFFGLPDVISERLREDARAQGKDDASYVRELLALRYQELIERGKSGKK